MENLPFYIPAVFISTTVVTLLIFYYASRQSTRFLLAAVGWLVVQAGLSLVEFYTITDTTPPRLLLALAPFALLLLALFALPAGRHWLDKLDLASLTLLHVVRLPVELVLFWLFLHKTIPGLMTFEGRNFDILSGITALPVYYFGFIKKRLSINVLLLWNVLCLLLVANIMFHGILSVPTVFQQFAFEQPNIALLYFPYTWLPSFVVPLVVLSHLAAIRLLLQKRKAKNPSTSTLPIVRSQPELQKEI